jgi:hypothetical protein
MSNGAQTEPDESASQRSENLGKAKKAVRLLFGIVLGNLALYLAVVSIRDLNTDTFFPTFLLFLSVAVSFGILLVIGLGERVDLSRVENEWIRKIAITPVMAVVAVLISILASFSPLAKLIVPTSNVDFMLANVGLTCDADISSTQANVLAASSLLAVVHSQDKKYIKQVDDYLREKPDNTIQRIKIFILNTILKEPAKFADISFVTQNQSDETYNLLKSFEDRHAIGSSGLSNQLSDNKEWIAYAVKIKRPRDRTSIPIPTIYDRHHSTRLFVILNSPPDNVKDPAVGLVNASINATPGSSIGSTVAQKTFSPYEKSLSALIGAEIAPQSPHGTLSETEMNVDLFYDSKHVCWTAGS